VRCAYALALEATLDSDLATPSDGVGGGAVVGDELVGPYRLKRIIGEGGMGHVYEATQEQPVRRRVALKRIKRGMDSEQILRRFESERQALALMSHPNIAQVYDAGSSTDGRPYFAMEYIEGSWITTYCDEHRLGVKQRLELFLQVCLGIEHAHQKGVIHRDIKPSNILVQTEDGRPVPKVIDFGVAKAVGARLGGERHMTKVGQLLGTPEYMSPEQAGPSSFDVDTRTDVYSLGIVLYELLTGQLPVAVARGDDPEIRRRLADEDTPSPSSRVAALGADAQAVAIERGTNPLSLVRRLRGELDWITKKAIDRDRNRRYGSPSELAADLLRHMRNEPVLAGPPSVGYRARKFVRRHRAWLTVAGFAIVGLVAFGVSMTVQARRIAAERESSEQVSKFLANMLGSVNPQSLGISLWKDLHDGVAVARRKRAAGQPQVEAALATLDETLAGVNATDTALRLLDEQILARAGQSLEREMAGQPRIAARLEHTLGDTYARLGLYKQAEVHAKRAVELRRSVLGAEHPDTVESAIALGNIYTAQGRYSDAEGVLRAALETSRRSLGREHPVTLSAMNFEAIVFMRQNRLDEAEALQRETLEIRRRVLGPDHPDTLRSMRGLADVHYRQERYDAAEPLQREAYTRWRATAGPEDRDTLNSMNSLANLLQQTSRFAEAEALHREALEINTRVNGHDHPATATSMNNLGNAIWSQGRMDEAEALLREALEIRRRILPVDHPNTLSSLHNLANVCKDQRRYEQAEALYREAYEARTRVLPLDHPDTIDDLYALACVAALRGDRKLALERLGQAIDHGYKDHPDSNPIDADTDLASLRGDPVFETLAAKARTGAAGR
jgi:non-specific serine/threonine protein kinase/serine/threonine-protein kinase